MYRSVMLATLLVRGARRIDAGVLLIGRMGSITAVARHVSSAASATIPRRTFMDASEPARDASRLHKITVRKGGERFEDKSTPPHPYLSALAGIVGTGV